MKAENLPRVNSVHLTGALHCAEKLMAAGCEVLLTTSRGTLAVLTDEGLMERLEGGGLRPCFLSRQDKSCRTNWGLRFREAGAVSWRGLPSAREFLRCLAEQAKAVQPEALPGAVPQKARKKAGKKEAA